MHKVLVNRLVKLAQEKSVVRQTKPPNMTIAVDWEVKHQTKQKLLCSNNVGFFFPVNPIEQFCHYYGIILLMKNSKNPDWLPMTGFIRGQLIGI